MNPEVVITPPVSDETAAIQAGATETVSEAAVEIAQINAEASVEITQSNNETVIELAQITAEQSEDDTEWLEARLGEFEARVGSLLGSTLSTLEPLLRELLSNQGKLLTLMTPSAPVEVIAEPIPELIPETPEQSAVGEAAPEVPRPRRKWLA